MGTTKSNKAKGRKLQQTVAKAVLVEYPYLTDADVVSTTMGQNGVDVQLSTAARKAFPFSVECKAKAKSAIYSDYSQAQANVLPNTHPLLVIKADYKEPLVVMSLEHFLKVLK